MRSAGRSSNVFQMTGKELDQELLQAAIAVRQNAYAPYSNFRVGCALRLKDGRIFCGVNVENCSYGLTVCAERHALAAAVAAGAQPGDIQMAVVVADSGRVATPCGACRQVMAEMMPLDASVHLHNLKDQKTVSITLGELLPQAFLRDNIPES